MYEAVFATQPQLRLTLALLGGTTSVKGRQRMAEVLGRRRVGVLGVFIAAACWLGMAGVAHAGTLSRDGSNAVVFTANPGESNNIDMFQDSGGYYIFDENQN